MKGSDMDTFATANATRRVLNGASVGVATQPFAPLLIAQRASRALLTRRRGSVSVKG
jgi:hypothetical protein